MYNRAPEPIPRPLTGPPPEAGPLPGSAESARARAAAARPSWEELWLTTQVLERLTPCLHTDDLLARLLALTREVFPHDAGLVARVEAQEPARVALAHAHGFDGLETHLPRQIPLARLIDPWPLAGGPLHVPDLAATPLQVADFFAQRGMRSLLGIPIPGGPDADTLVLLVLADHRPAAFAHIEPGRLAHFQRALSIPLASAREIEARSRQDQTLLRYAQDLWAVVDESATVEARLGHLLDVALPIAGADAGAFMVVLGESQELLVRASRGLQEHAPAECLVPWGSRSSAALRPGAQPFSIRPLQPPGERPVIGVARDEGFQTYLGLPIMEPGSPAICGLLNLYWRRDVTELRADQLGLLQSLTRAGAVLLEQSALRERCIRSDRLLAQFQAHKAQMITLIGHQLRTPITAIGGFAQLLARRAPSGDTPIGRYAETIQAECRRLGVLIDNVLELSRLEGSLLVVQVRPFDVVALLQALHADPLLRGQGGSETPVWSLQERVPVVLGDPLRLKQALVALLRRLPLPDADVGAPPENGRPLPALTLRPVPPSDPRAVEIRIEVGGPAPTGATVDELLAALDLRQVVDSPQAQEGELELYSALQLLRAMGAGVRTEPDGQGRDGYVVSLPVLEET